MSVHAIMGWKGSPSGCGPWAFWHARRHGGSVSPSRAWVWAASQLLCGLPDSISQQSCFVFLPFSSTCLILWSRSHPQPLQDLSFSTTEMTSCCPLTYLNPPRCVSTCFSLLFGSAVRYKYHSWAFAIPAKQKGKRHSIICMWGGLCCFSRNYSFQKQSWTVDVGTEGSMARLLLPLEEITLISIEYFSLTFVTTSLYLLCMCKTGF